MPHEKGSLSSVTGTVAVDHRKALTITPGGTLDNCQIENPLKIHKRKALFEECADADIAKSSRKRPKIHWTQLAASGASSESAHRHNGRQATDQKDSMLLDIKRRQVKVILIDVFQTEEGQSYLSSCGSNTNAKTPSQLKKALRERQSESGPTTEHSTVRRRASATRKDQSKFSPHKLTNSPSSKTTDSECVEESNMNLSKEVQSPGAKRCLRFNSSLKQTEHVASDVEESCSLEQTDCPSNKKSHNQLLHTALSDTAEDELCQGRLSDSPNPSEEADLEQNSESLITATHTPSKVKQPGGFCRTKHKDSETEAAPTQQNNSENEAQGCEENKSEKEGEIEHHNGEVLDESGGARGSVLRLSTGAAESQLADGEVTPKSSQIAGSADKHTLDSELVEIRQATKPQPTEPIVLSSEEEEEEEKDRRTLHVQAVEGAKDPQRQHKPVQAMERKKIPDAHVPHSDLSSQDNEPPLTSREAKLWLEEHSSEFEVLPFPPKQPDLNVIRHFWDATQRTVELGDPTTELWTILQEGSSFEASALSGCPVMELQFSALYMGNISAVTNGLVKITDDTITFSFKDDSGCEVKAFLATSYMRKYSVWDGQLVRDSCLVKENEAPPPSVLLLWMTGIQARRLSNDLSVFQPGTRPAEGSTCVLLCVSEPLNGVQGALLASIMDIVGLRHGNADLLSPVTHADCLKVLHNNRDTHMLQLLLPRAETHAVSPESGTVLPPSSTTTTSAVAQDSDTQQDSRVYTVCQSRGQGAYSVSLAHKPGADWTPYRHCGPARRLIQFPPPPSKGAITVTTEDLECLDSGEFLNDVIIDFYLKYLLVQKAPHASVRRSHVFSSFFYKQLTRRDNANEDSTSTPAQLRRHQRVRTWTRHVDIFEKDFLFVPVNQEAHWYLVVVCFPGLDEPQYVEKGGHVSDDGTENSSDATVQSESQHGDGDINSDENSSKSVSAPSPPTCTENTCKRRTVCKRPCILIMDSLKLSVHERIFKLLREYLQAEWEVKRGGYRDFSAERMVGSHCRVPLQDNSSDCGLYLLQYAESFLQDPVVHFDLPLQLDCWFPRQKVREKREEIRELVLRLYRFQQGSLENNNSEDGKEIGHVA